MISYLKKHFVIVIMVLIATGGIAMAQQYSPITLAPNADPRIYSNPDFVRYDGQVRSAGLSIGKTTAPVAGYLLDVAGDILVKRDYLEGKHNCVRGINSTNGNNKCYRFYSALFSGITTPRVLFPEFISTSLMSVYGGVVVSGISDTNNAALTNSGSLLGLTSGAKLDITGAIQGDPSGAYMNHATGLDYPGNNCSVSTSPTCKKYACIDTVGNIVSCTDKANQVDARLGPARSACSDGIDNDGDGADGADPQCYCPNGNYYQQWDSETTAPSGSAAPCYSGPAL